MANFTTLRKLRYLEAFSAKIKFLLIRQIMPRLIACVCALLPRNKQRLLIIKADGIGDYLLFRNFLRFLNDSEKYNQHQFYLAVNTSNKEFARHLDGDLIQGFFGYSEGFFLRWELVRLLWQLQRMRFETIIYPNFSRSFQVDWLIAHLGARHKIGVDGDCINQRMHLKNKSNKFYTDLIKTGVLPMHEFLRNRSIAELITGEKCLLPAPFIERDKLDIVDHGAVLIFPGASNDDKKWPEEYFYDLCRRIYLELNSPVIVAPGKGDEFGRTAAGLNIPDSDFRVANGLSMEALCNLIGGAALLISGDTVAVHIAAALGVPTVCICKGDLYGRFVPYPAAIFDRLYCVLPRNVKQETLHYSSWSPAIITDVERDDVFETVRRLMVPQKKLPNDIA